MTNEELLILMEKTYLRVFNVISFKDHPLAHLGVVEYLVTVEIGGYIHLDTDGRYVQTLPYPRPNNLEYMWYIENSDIINEK